MLKTAQESFTDAYLRRVKPARGDQWFSDPHSRRGEGALTLRVRLDGRKEFYFRERREGRNRLVRIGRFQQTPGDGGLSVSEAVKQFKTLSEMQKRGGVKEQLALARDDQRKKEETLQRELKAGTLAHLLADYVAHLRANGKVSAPKVERDLKRCVLVPFPALARKRARSITPTDIQEVLASMIQRGLTRSTNQIHTYLKTAFTFGAKSEYSPKRAAAGKVSFGLTGNPATLVEYSREFDRADDRVLSEAELALFWHALDGTNLVHAAALRLGLLLGGQRLEQLLRADWSHYDEAKGLLHLRDAKGRGAAREHLLPVFGTAKDQLEILRSLNGDKASPFVGVNGARLRADSLSSRVSRIAAEMVQQYAIARFRMGDLRRTCETMLAALGVDKETRAQLLSHGRTSGVQAKHYDRHHYLPEKTRALQRWHAKLEEILSGERQSNVVKLRG